MKLISLLLVFCLSSTAYAQVRPDSTKSLKVDTQGVVKNASWLSIHSNPEGAEVYEGALFLGTTPIDRLPASAGRHVVAIFFPSARFWNSVSNIDTLEVVADRESTRSIDLAIPAQYGIFKRETQTREKNPNLFLKNANQENSRVWQGYVAGATMVLTGALSAYLKTHSDNEFDAYIVTGDPERLSSTRRLDKWAGVTLFISEISFGYLTYLLLSE